VAGNLEMPVVAWRGTEKAYGSLLTPWLIPAGNAEKYTARDCVMHHGETAISTDDDIFPSAAEDLGE
jgi:hypothetical protein